MSLEEFDDENQTKELVYAITKDDAAKRITLVFRGTDTSLAFRTNWSANLDSAKVKGAIPESLKKLVPSMKEMKFHSGFYDYVFNKTADQNDNPDIRKYDQILEDVKAQLKKHRGYKLYVTGHSLGAALSTLVSFYLSCEPDEDIPKPVMNINFASPRLADVNVLRASEALERAGKLRIFRVT